MSAAPSSDALYHRLFGHPLMVEQLLRAFVPEILAEGVDFSRMERVNSKFHAKRGGHRRESDIIWWIPLCDGSYIFVSRKTRVSWPQRPRRVWTEPTKNSVYASGCLSNKTTVASIAIAG